MIDDTSTQLYHADEWSDRLLWAAMPNDKWHKRLSLFNEHEVPSMCVCLCVQADCRENWVKLFVLIWTCTSSFPPTSAQTHKQTHSHALAHILPCRVLSRCSSFLLYYFIPVPISLPGDSGSGTCAATGTDMNKAVIIKTTHQKQYEL